MAVNHIIDIGSGLGHLSRLLSMQYKLNVATIDAVSNHTSTAINFDKQALNSLLKYKSHLATQHTNKDGNHDDFQGYCELPCHLEGRISIDTSKDVLQQILHKAWPTDSNATELPISLLGLHTCGDLAVNLLKMFVQIPQVKVLLSVSCCYMKLNEDGDGKGYPLSNHLKRIPHSPLSYEARQLCCHAIESYVERLQGNYSTLKIHCYRAVLEKVIVESCPHARHVGLRSVKNAENLTFSEYAVKALSKSSLNIPHAALESPINTFYLEEWKKVVVMYSLRLITAPVIESLILLDRMLYLFEKGSTSYLVPIFDPHLSPRNSVLLAVKVSDSELQS